MSTTSSLRPSGLVLKPGYEKKRRRETESENDGDDGDDGHDTVKQRENDVDHVERGCGESGKPQETSYQLQELQKKQSEEKGKDEAQTQHEAQFQDQGHVQGQARKENAVEDTDSNNIMDNDDNHHQNMDKHDDQGKKTKTKTKNNDKVSQNATDDDKIDAASQTDNQTLDTDDNNGDNTSQYQHSRDEIDAKDSIDTEDPEAGKNRPSIQFGKDFDRSRYYPPKYYWQIRLKDLKKYKEKHGHVDVPKNEGSLGRWVYRQRDFMRRGTLSEDRVKQLMDLGFSTTEKVKSAWDIKFEELQEWTRVNGHSCVPTLHGELGVWVAKQRQYKKHGMLSKERVAKMDSLNFLWNPGEVDWQEKFQLLLMWSKEHGHTRVPFNQGELGWWVNAQRQCYKKGKLAENRIRQLEEIGFVWSIMKNKKKKEESIEPIPIVIPPANVVMENSYFHDPQQRPYPTYHDTVDIHGVPQSKPGQVASSPAPASTTRRGCNPNKRSAPPINGIPQSNTHGWPQSNYNHGGYRASGAGGGSEIMGPPQDRNHAMSQIPVSASRNLPRSQQLSQPGGYSHVQQLSQPSGYNQHHPDNYGIGGYGEGISPNAVMQISERDMCTCSMRYALRKIPYGAPPPPAPSPPQSNRDITGNFDFRGGGRNTGLCYDSPVIGSTPYPSHMVCSSPYTAGPIRDSPQMYNCQYYSHSPYRPSNAPLLSYPIDDHTLTTQHQHHPQYSQHHNHQHQHNQQQQQFYPVQQNHPPPPPLPHLELPPPQQPPQHLQQHHRQPHMHPTPSGSVPPHESAHSASYHNSNSYISP